MDKDGCDELIVTAGLGNTTTANGSNTVMKIYDLVNGRFEASYTQELSGRQNKDSRFDFKWDVGRWVHKDIAVVGYAVNFNQDDTNNIPPVAPVNLSVKEKDNNRITLQWTQPSDADGRMSANKAKVYYKKASDSDYTFALVDLNGQAGQKEWTLNDLDRNTTYKCYVTNVFYENSQVRYESVPSDEIIETTGDQAENVTVTITKGKGLTHNPNSGAEEQTVDKGANKTIEAVYYTVDNGYEIPSSFLISSNGITAEPSGNSLIKVSGKPTDNTAIQIGDMNLAEYEIEYDLGGGTLNDPVRFYTIESDTIILPTPVRYGCIFAGWKDKTGAVITEIPKGSAGNKKLYAQWKDLSLLGYSQNYPADGSEQYPYIISSANGWNFFCECLETDSFKNFSEKYVKLGSNRPDLCHGNRRFRRTGIFLLDKT